ncbi:hypothetical protein [Sandarakinorhabdus sp.]|uniref:hypothetical protein n=1 Tax=Sandarakinorhabdus sp. TaxID=1916663 RepID=UPI00286E5AAD|nr:hypothetical protein [Sandarakinorhabdus sp.]
MRKSFASLAFLALSLAAVPAFAAPEEQLGATVQANIAAMVVDLNPTWAGVPMEGTSGILGERAFRRYRTDATKPLIPLSGKSNVGQVSNSAATVPQGSN